LLDSKRASTRGVGVHKLQCGIRTVTIRGHRRLEDDRAAQDVHDRERVQVAVRVDTYVVQPICEHPLRPPAQTRRTGF